MLFGPSSLSLLRIMVGTVHLCVARGSRHRHMYVCRHGHLDVFREIMLQVNSDLLDIRGLRFSKTVR